MKFCKKPIEIDAIRFDGTNRDALLAFVGAAFVIEKGYAVFILTLEGEMRVSPGDYVIRGIKGEYYPCKPDIFEASYEATDGSAPPWNT